MLLDENCPGGGRRGKQNEGEAEKWSESVQVTLQKKYSSAFGDTAQDPDPQKSLSDPLDSFDRVKEKEPEQHGEFGGVLIE